MYAAAKPTISEFQHDFVKNRSTTSNLLSFTNDVSTALESKQQVDAIYLDFSKAFDRVPHDLAVAKCDRSAFVNFNGTRSRDFAMTSGVPQGSVLGPLVFVLFVNDLCFRLKSGKVLFADDLKIYRTISSLPECCALQADIDELQQWCIENGMELNTKKCKCITFTRKQSRIEFE